jgi:hypothetical protein
MLAHARSGVRLVVCVAFAPIGMFACGGRTIGAGNGSGASNIGAFLGTWTCQDTATITLTTEKTPPGVSPVSRTDVLTFVAKPDGTLAMTGDTVAVGSAPDDAGEACGFYTFSFSGSTATALGGPVCSIGGATFSATSGTFVVSGATATITLVTAVSPSMTGSTVVPSTDSVTGTCTKTG